MASEIAGALLALLMTAGCCIWWTVIRQLRAGVQPWRKYEVPPAEGEFGVLFATVIVWLLIPSLALLGLGARPEEESLRRVLVIGLGQVLTFIVVGSMVVPGARRRLSFGIRFDHVPQQMLDGVVGFLACVPPVAIGAVLTSPLRDEKTQNLLLRILEHNPGWQSTAAILVVAGVLAPLVEELVFRSVLQSGLQSVLRTRNAIVLVALLFSAVHGWPDMLPLFPLALLLGLLFHLRRSLIAVVTTHLLFNATNLAYALLTESAN